MTATRWVPGRNVASASIVASEGSSCATTWPRWSYTRSRNGETASSCLPSLDHSSLVGTASTGPRQTSHRGSSGAAAASRPFARPITPAGRRRGAAPARAARRARSSRLPRPRPSGSSGSATNLAGSPGPRRRAPPQRARTPGAGGSAVSAPARAPRTPHGQLAKRAPQRPAEPRPPATSLDSRLQLVEGAPQPRVNGPAWQLEQLGDLAGGVLEQL